jgi:hypothetical protein
MQRDLVERRRWISLKDYKEGLALAQLAPGPLAAQLAIYLGWLDHGVLGATLVAIAFVLPSFVMVFVLSALYLAYGGLSWMQGAFYGIGAAVIAIIARSVHKLVKRTLGSDWLLWALFLVSAFALRGRSRSSSGCSCSAASSRWSPAADRAQPRRSCSSPGRNSHRRARSAGVRPGACVLLRRGGRVRVRERTGHRAVPARAVVNELGCPPSGSSSTRSPSR